MTEMPVSSPMSNASFWNEIFIHLGWEIHWVNGQVCTNEMSVVAARALIDLVEGRGWFGKSS